MFAFFTHFDFAKIKTVKFLNSEIFKLAWSIITQVDAKININGIFMKVCTYKMSHYTVYYSKEEKQMPVNVISVAKFHSIQNDASTD